MKDKSSYRYKRDLYIKDIESKFPASKGLLHLLEWIEVDDGLWIFSEGAFPNEPLYQKIFTEYNSNQ